MITPILSGARLQKIFNLRPGEERMAALILGYAILLFSANVLAMTASMGLFFGAYDAATLPYTYVLLMFIGPMTSLIYMRINGRLPLSQALLVVHIALLLSLIVLPLVLNYSQAPLLRFVLPVYLEISVILTYTSFWNLLGRIYNLRQGKRLFPFLSSGEHLATIGAGFISTFFVVRIGAANLYWLGALCMAGAAALLVVISSANPQLAASNGKPAEDAGEGASNLSALLKEPYVRFLLVLVALYTISVVLVENLSFIQAEMRFPTADGMAAYVGLFMAIYGVLGLLLQWVIAGRALDRFGVSAAMLALPGGLLIFMFLFALVGTFNAASVVLFWLAAGANMVAYTLDAPYMAAKNVMLQPLPAHLRTQTETTTTGIAYPVATGLAGLLLLFLTHVLGFQSVQIAYVILVVLALWAIAVYQFGRVYVRRLRKALLARAGFRFGPGLLHAADRTTVSVLEEALSAPNPSVVLYALKLLAEVAPGALSGHLPDLLVYPDDKVRVAALEFVAGTRSEAALAGKGPWSEALAGIERLLEPDHAPEVRAAALRAWRSRPADSLAAYACDPQIAVRRAALAMMLGQEEAAVRRQAWEKLDDLARSVETAERIVAAGVIEELGKGEIEKRDRGRDDHIVEEVLLTLLADWDPRVLRAALAAAVHTRSPEVWAAIIPALAQHSTDSLAANALSAGGEDVLPLLQAVCREAEQDPRIVAGIARVCGRIGVPEAVRILKSLAAHTDANVRRRALLGLSRCAYRAEAEERAAVEEQFRLLAAALAQIVAAQADIGEVPQVRLTADALEQRRRIETDNLLLLSSFLDEAQTVLGAREALRLGDDEEEKRAYAVEMLDILLDHEFKTILFPFVRQLEPQQRLDALQKQFPQTLLGRRRRLHALLAGERDRWTRICAIYALGLLEDETASAETVSAVMDTAVCFSDDPVLVETALAAMASAGTVSSGLDKLGTSPQSITVPELEEGVERWRARDPGTMTLLQKVDALKQAGILADLPGEELEAVAALLEVVTASAGETIIQMGDPGDCMYVVVDGQLRVHAGERDFDTVGAGDVVGEMALLDTEPRSASVTALTQSRLLRLDQDLFYDLLDGNAQVARELLHLLSARLRERTADVVSQTGREAAQPVQPMIHGHNGRGNYVPFQGELTALDKLLFLRGVDFFSEINDDLLEQVALLLEEVDLARGEQLFAQGDAGHSLYIVTAGQMRIHIEGRTLAFAGEGEVIGEMALLESRPRLATVTGSMESLLLRLDQQPFFELIEVQPDLARGMIRTLSGRLRARLLELGALLPEPGRAGDS